MRNFAKFLLLASLLTFFIAGVLTASELEESFKQELDRIYSSYMNGSDLPSDQFDLLVQYGYVAAPGSRGSDRVSDPDAFGYTFIDNEEDNGPEFNWIDISATGSIIDGLADDNYVGPFDIGFDFPMYDQEYTQFYFQSNGTISFTDSYVGLTNYTIPTTNAGALIAWFWDDLDPEAPGGGTVYYESTEVNGQTALVISMIDYKDYPDDDVITAQIIMYESGKILLQYQDIDEGFDIESCTIGIQNSTGDIGLQYLYNDDPTGYPYEGLAIQFANSDAVVDGTVTDSNSGDAIANAEVYLYPDGMTEPAYIAITDANGDFHFEVLSATFDLEVLAVGYMPYRQEDLVVEPDDALDLTIELDEPQNQYVFNGSILSADTQDLAVEGVTIEITGAAGTSTTTTGANGAYSFGDMLEGLYDIYISFDPAGSAGYHDLVIENFQFAAAGPHDFLLYEILIPQDFSVTNGDGFAGLTWSAPANHQDLAVLAHTIELRRGYLNDLRALNNAKSEEMIPAIEAELYMLENEYNRMLTINENGLDELSDFAGYRVMMDDVILPDIVTGTSTQVWDLVSGEFYDFRVAADYGYGDDYLVWTDEVTLEYFEVTYFHFDLEEYNWIEIDPATGVASTSLSLSDDGESGFIDFPNGETFLFYGQAFSNFNIGANGAISFTSAQITHMNTTIPSTNEPNNTICPFWEDLYPPATNDGDPWYYYDETLNQMIITWNNPPLGAQDNTLKFQVILDLTNDYFIINYDSAVSGWDTGATIGVENAAGTRGVTWLDDEGNVRIPEDQTSVIWTTGQGIFGALEGVVDNSDGTLLEDVLIEIYNPDGTDPIRTGITGADGSYRISQLWEGTYDLRFIKHPYSTVAIEDVEILPNEDTTLDVTMSLETTQVALSGTVMSSDTPDTPVEGASVYCYELEETQVTDANGDFSFGQQLIGQYNFRISFDPQGSTGYHNISYLLQDVAEGFDGFEFTMFEILPVENFTATAGDGFITLTWAPPLNHVNLVVLTDRINRVRQYIENVNNLNINNPAKIEATLAEYEAELFRLENELVRRESLNNIDDLEDFMGYKIILDDEVQNGLLSPTTLSIVLLDDDWNFENGVSYEFSVAADYGYGDDYLVGADPVTVDYTEINYFYLEMDNMEWIEIDPATGVASTSLDLSDDGYTDNIAFPTGETFIYYGTEYSTFTVSANGVISFTPGYITYGNQTIPNTQTPNNIVCPFWEDLYPPATENGDPWYYYDEDNNQMIVEWYNAPLGNTDNLMKFEVIIDLTDDFFLFLYDSATEDWNTGATIGIENALGTRGVVYPDAPEDGLCLFFGTALPAGGELEGYVSYCSTEDYDPISNAAVYLVGNPEPIAYTDADGYFSADSIRTGWREFRIMKDGYWPIDIAALEIIEDQTVSIDTVALTDPDGQTSENSLMMNIPIGTAESDSSAEISFSLESIGCGPLVYRARLTLDETALSDGNEFSGNVLPGNRPLNELDELDEPWSYIFGMGLPDSDDMYSAVVTSGAVYAVSIGADPTFYQYNTNGTLITSMEIPTTMQADDGSGIMDMSTDPFTGNILSGNADGDFFRFNPEMTNIQNLGNIGMSIVAIAYDYINDYVYFSDGAQLMMLDLSTYSTTDYTVPAGVTGPITGLGYMETDPDNANVYMLAQGESGGGYVFRFNPETQVWMEDVHQVYQDAWGMSGGMDISNGYNTGMLNVTTVMQAATSNDFVDIWEGQPAPVSWLWIASGGEGTLQPEESEEIEIHGDIRNTEIQVQNGDIINATVELTGPYWDTPIDIDLDVVFVVNGLDEENLMPTKYALHQNYPNPFNPMTEIKFDLINAQDVKLSVYNVLGRQVTTLINQRVEAGFHSVTFDATNLASGIYFYRIEAGEFTNLKKMVLVK